MEVREISYDLCKPFILNIHYSRHMPSFKYGYGLFNDDYLIGVVTYGVPASPFLCEALAGYENRLNVLELNRLVILPNSPRNSASYLVSHSLKMLPKDLFIVSYADTGWGHIGYVYQATNWIYTGLTSPHTDPAGKSGHARTHKSVPGGERQIRTQKHRYVYFTGNKKKQLKQLKFPVINEYPKGDSVHYDLDNPTPVDKRIFVSDEVKRNIKNSGKVFLRKFSAPKNYKKTSLLNKNKD